MMDIATRYSKLWEPLGKEEKDSEKMERPSLTFLQDGWRKLKANFIAVICLFFIVVITLGAIIIPWLWPYTYYEQNLMYANMPARIRAYAVDDTTYVYVTPQYSLVALSPSGKLRSDAKLVRKDVLGKRNTYSIDGHEITIDYSTYILAVKEYRKLEQEKVNTVTVSDVPYLKSFFGKDAPQTITLRQAKVILENKLQKIIVTCDDRTLDKQKTIWNKTYLLGTDSLGRDLFIRIVYGARISITVGIVAALINFIVGVLYGGIAGYLGGNIDNVMMRIVDVIDSIPTTLYVILIMVIVGSGLTSIILALGLTFWVKMARIVRGQVLSLKKQEFVKAAVVVGADTKRILLKHLIPNMMGPIMVNIAMQIPSAIFNEAFLSFIGLGISAPMASWGTLCNDALAGIYVYPYQMAFPAIAISVTILAFNLFSDGLRDAFDPKITK